MKHNSDRILDARGNAAKYLNQIIFEYLVHGYVHVINTGLNTKEELLQLLPTLGFSEERSFKLGGRACDEVQKKWVTEGLLRRLDYYPAKHYLLPNTEVQYLKVNPQDVLFYVEHAPSANSGGRIFIHNIKHIEQLILEQVGGENLINKISQYGLKIVTGYVDEHHPHRALNYMKSWQQLSGCENIYEAVVKLKAMTTHFDEVWIKTLPDNSQVVMTDITNPGKLALGSEEFLNMPRIAKTPPSFENGFREFLLGNNEPLSENDNQILLKAYEDSQLGYKTSQGDLFLFNNTTYAHSREAFSEPNQRSVLVAMGGVKFSGLHENEINQLLISGVVTAEQIAPIPSPKFALPQALVNAEESYVTTSVSEQINDNFSIPVFDLQGEDLADADIIDSIHHAFKLHGRLHITGNDKYIDLIPEDIRDLLSFSQEEQFKWGGKKSGRTERFPKGNGFYTVDKYPAELTLLPHQEIFYQRVLPQRMMFHYRKVSGAGFGGRTLSHCGQKLEFFLSQSLVGQEIIAKFTKYGQMIVTGF